MGKKRSAARERGREVVPEEAAYHFWSEKSKESAVETSRRARSSRRSALAAHGSKPVLSPLPQQQQPYTDDVVATLGMARIDGIFTGISRRDERRRSPRNLASRHQFHRISSDFTSSDASFVCLFFCLFSNSTRFHFSAWGHWNLRFRNQTNRFEID